MIGYDGGIDTVPLIYVGSRVETRLGWVPRILFGLLSAGCFAVLITAARLTPNANGMGTHLQLGLDECGFLARTGYPCMSCGMTTSFTYLAHGDLLHSLWAQPAGTVFCITAAALAWAGLYIALTGRPSGRLLHRLPIVQGVMFMLAIAILAWGYKIAMVIHARPA